MTVELSLLVVLACAAVFAGFIDSVVGGGGLGGHGEGSWLGAAGLCEGIMHSAVWQGKWSMTIAGLVGDCFWQ